MSRIRSSDTSLELLVRKYLFSKGYRYRLRYNLPGKPDIVFPGKKIAVFVNGCFWHLHGCKLSKIPSTRTEFWAEKLKKNKERDENVRKSLEDAGWNVLKIWECDLTDNFDSTMNAVEEFINTASVIRRENTS